MVARVSGGWCFFHGFEDDCFFTHLLKYECQGNVVSGLDFCGEANEHEVHTTGLEFKLVAIGQRRCFHPAHPHDVPVHGHRVYFSCCGNRRVN